MSYDVLVYVLFCRTSDSQLKNACMAPVTFCWHLSLWCCYGLLW